MLYHKLFWWEPSEIEQKAREKQKQRKTPSKLNTTPKFLIISNKIINSWKFLLFKIIVLVYTNRHIPSATHPFGKHNQVTSSNFNWLIWPTRKDLHFSFQKIASLFGFICPWELTWRATPSVIITSNGCHTKWERDQTHLKGENKTYIWLRTFTSKIKSLYIATFVESIRKIATFFHVHLILLNG